MGYTTDFSGHFVVTPALKPEHHDYLRAFNESRRMKRDSEKASLLPDPKRIAAGLPIGDQGAYFVGADGFKGQDRDDSVLDYNVPPGHPNMPLGGPQDFTTRFHSYWQEKQKAVFQGAQPSLWCQWTPNDEGTAIEWDEGEKFYEYIPWIEYLIKHFLEPWGYELNGTVMWSGEEFGDQGAIRIENNVVSIGTPTFKFEKEEDS